MASESDDKNFIRERKSGSLWLFLALLLLIYGMMWGLSRFENKVLAIKRGQTPFMQVTNRAFSLFLWQNPSFMRANQRYKLGYLPQFSSDDDIRVVPELADDYVSAPLPVLFRYHVWHRLIGDSAAPRPVIVEEFREFLAENHEWTPHLWPKAPPEYVKLVQGLDRELANTDLQSRLPLEVRLAFQGWRNYFHEWSDINSLVPTVEEMRHFLEEHPHYNRSYWRNILQATQPDYLQSFMWGPETNAQSVNTDELSTFLRVALYNYSTVTKPSG